MAEPISAGIILGVGRTVLGFFGDKGSTKLGRFLSDRVTAKFRPQPLVPGAPKPGTPDEPFPDATGPGFGVPTAVTNLFDFLNLRLPRSEKFPDELGLVFPVPRPAPVRRGRSGSTQRDAPLKAESLEDLAEKARQADERIRSPLPSPIEETFPIGPVFGNPVLVDILEEVRVRARKRAVESRPETARSTPARSRSPAETDVPLPDLVEIDLTRLPQRLPERVSQPQKAPARVKTPPIRVGQILQTVGAVGQLVDLVARQPARPGQPVRGQIDIPPELQRPGDLVPEMQTFAQPQATRTRDRTKEDRCEKTRRKNRRVCWEGFYREYRGKTKFTKWTQVDCRTRRIIQER